MPQNKGWTFVQLPIWVLCDDKISDDAKILLAYLRWPQMTRSIEKTAKDLHISKKDVRNRLTELEEFNYVIINYAEGSSFSYKLT